MSTNIYIHVCLTLGMPIINLPWSEYNSFRETLKGIEEPGAQKVLEYIHGTEDSIAYVFADQLIKPDQKEVNDKKIKGFVELTENQVAITRRELVMLQSFLYLTICELRKLGRSDLLIFYETLFSNMEERHNSILSETTKKRLENISLANLILEAIK